MILKSVVVASHVLGVNIGNLVGVTLHLLNHLKDQLVLVSLHRPQGWTVDAQENYGQCGTDAAGHGIEEDMAGQQVS